jgi:hypothetical protein
MGRLGRPHRARPVVTGHEFAGEIVEIGRNVERPDARASAVSGEGHLIGKTSRAVPRGQVPPRPRNQRHRRERTGRLRRVPPPAGVQRRAPARRCRRRDRRHPRPARQRRAHGALLRSGLGEDVLVTGAGPIGIMAAAVAAMPAPATSSSPTSTPTALTWPAEVADVRPVNVRRGPARRDRGPRPETRLRCRLRDVRQSGRARPDGRTRCHGRPHRASRHPAGKPPGGLERIVFKASRSRASTGARSSRPGTR